ncbi:unnamed protein product [Sphagnum jensenii]|uniref:Secreted protein n=1 Tax=Sphagnum jensenii TaxID=128206 RepID=A0ABP0W590_9BRYO
MWIRWKCAVCFPFATICRLARHLAWCISATMRCRRLSDARQASSSPNCKLVGARWHCYFAYNAWKFHELTPASFDMRASFPARQLLRR